MKRTFITISMLFALLSLTSLQSSFAQFSSNESHQVQTENYIESVDSQNLQKNHSEALDKERSPASIESDWDAPQQYCCKVCKKERPVATHAFQKVKDVTKLAVVPVMDNRSFNYSLKEKL